jgi:hypothetical protein
VLPVRRDVPAQAYCFTSDELPLPAATIKQGEFTRAMLPIVFPATLVHSPILPQNPAMKVKPVPVEPPLVDAPQTRHQDPSPTLRLSQRVPLAIVCVLPGFVQGSPL